MVLEINTENFENEVLSKAQTTKEEYSQITEEIEAIVDVPTEVVEDLLEEENDKEQELVLEKVEEKLIDTSAEEVEKAETPIKRNKNEHILER